MSLFCCPVCSEVLYEIEGGLICRNNHRFDFAKRHYVNLLLSRKSSEKQHGDDKLMVQARTRFFNNGYYKPLCTALCDAVLKHCKTGSVLLDAATDTIPLQFLMLPVKIFLIYACAVSIYQRNPQNLQNGDALKVSL